MNAEHLAKGAVPDLSARQLKAVASVARYGSFIAAAADMGISQSAVSRLVQQVEAALGLALFARTTRRVSLTAAGREFAPAAERLLDDLGLQVRNLQALGEQLRGRVVISCLMSLTHHVLPDAIRAYRQQHPNIAMQVREGLGSAVQEDVRSGVADFGIGNAIGLHESVAVEAVVQEACHVVLPRGHRLAKRAAIPLAELKDEQMISMPPESGLRRIIDGVAAAHGLTLNHMVVVDHFATLYDFVAGGIGIAIVPASALARAERAPLVARPLAAPAIARQIGILRLKARPLSPAAEGFLALFRPQFLRAPRR